MATISQVKDLNGNLHDINAATVDGHTVASNVPANAIFTDTTYALVGAQNTTGLIKNGSDVSDVSEMTPCPIVGGVPYYSGGSGSTGLLHVSVPMSDWTGDDTNGWSQTVAAVGVTADADCNPKIDIEHVANTSKADWEVQCEAYSTFTTTGWAETGADTITLNCSERPGADFNILVSYGGGIDVMQVTTETGTVVQENVNSPTTVPSSAVVYDLKADSDSQISAINESIAVIESSSTASQSYSVGQQFVYNGLLYEATSAIASGGTITPGSNCARTTVAEELSALNDSLNESVTDLENQISQNAIPIINSASGAIASFNDGVDDVPVRDLVVNIEPVQSGSGDPSPDNVRPISGWTGAEVQRCGKNLLGLTLYDGFSYNKPVGSKVTITESSKSLVDNQDGTFTLSNATAWQGCALMFYMKANVQYHLHVALEGTGQRLTLGKVSLDGTILTVSNNSESSYTININPINAEDCYWYLYIVSNQSNYSITITEPQAELGSTATAYEPYSGQTYNVDWETEAGTVYGGTLDVTTGTLIATWKAITMDGTTSSTAGRMLAAKASFEYANMFYAQLYSANNNVAYQAITNENLPFIRCSHAIPVKWVTSQIQEIVDIGKVAFTWIAVAGGTQRIQPRLAFPLDSEIDTVEKANAFLAEQYENGTPVVYTVPMRTPQTYHLTPTEVMTLLGQNNIFADTGDIESVEYVADTKTYIDNKFAELQALVLENA